MERQRELLRLHRELDLLSRNAGDAEFLSGWQTSHPFAEHYLLRVQDGSPRSVEEYSFLSDSAALTESIRKFHRTRDGIDYPPEAVYAASGSSPLLMAFFLRLREQGVSEAWYVPPIYYTCYYFAQSVGITLHRLDTSPLHHPETRLRLPQRPAVLIFADPIWVFGTPVHPVHIKEIAEWQRRFGSEVLVDGTFQYTAWNPPDQAEATSELDLEHTFRIVCPTKSTAVHGSRFAYLLMPPGQRESIRYPAANLTGASGAQAQSDALRLMEVLNSPQSNRELREHIATVHGILWDKGVIRAEAAPPSVTYYTFAHIDERRARSAILMDQRFFDLTGFNGFARINLLHPSWLEL
ncbi:aminotransferase class I/II-fold pyridoxal phosphate-dependent enzyme [Streptomyces sp. NBC_00510]